MIAHPQYSSSKERKKERKKMIYPHQCVYVSDLYAKCETIYSYIRNNYDVD